MQIPAGLHRDWPPGGTLSSGDLQISCQIQIWGHGPRSQYAFYTKTCWMFSFPEIQGRYSFSTLLNDLNPAEPFCSYSIQRFMKLSEFPIVKSSINMICNVFQMTHLHIPLRILDILNFFRQNNFRHCLYNKKSISLNSVVPEPGAWRISLRLDKISICLRIRIHSMQSIFLSSQLVPGYEQSNVVVSYMLLITLQLLTTLMILTILMVVTTFTLCFPHCLALL